MKVAPKGQSKKSKAKQQKSVRLSTTKRFYRGKRTDGRKLVYLIFDRDIIEASCVPVFLARDLASSGLSCIMHLIIYSFLYNTHEQCTDAYWYFLSWRNFIYVNSKTKIESSRYQDRTDGLMINSHALYQLS